MKHNPEYYWNVVKGERRRPWPVLLKYFLEKPDASIHFLTSWLFVAIRLFYRRVKRFLKFSWRRLSASKRMTPDFMIIGYQKCGTTSLFNYLIQHPAIVPPMQKEIKYFDLNSSRNAHWYKAHFPLREEKNNLITGEATPDYIFFPEIAAKIVKFNSKVKLIVICRNPVDRAFSQYKFSVRRGIEPYSFAEALEKESQRLAEATQECRINKKPLSENRKYREFSYTTRGLYAQQLKSWLDAFPRDQFLFLCTEELKKNPDAVLKKITSFLGMADFSFCTQKKYLQAPKSDAMPSSIRKKLIDYYMLENKELFELLGEHFDW